MDTASTNEIQEIIDIGRSHSFDFAVYDATFLQKTIEKRMSAAQIGCVGDYCLRMRESPAEAETLFRSLYVQFSVFFREPLSFALLEQSVIPGLVADAPANGELRVWSAGCAFGQEAYSLAMLLDEQMKKAGKPLRYRIFATDVSEGALSFARRGVYPPADVQNVKQRHLGAYFIRQGEEYAVIPRLKRGVGFTRYDVLDAASANPPESIFGNFDIVSCCNLMMYYGPEARLMILHKLEESLSPAGRLIVGETERAFVERNTALDMLCVPAAVFRKASGRKNRR